MLAGTEVWQWIQGLELLSLDFSRAVYSYLGVGVNAEETLRGLARDTLAGRYSGMIEPFQLDHWTDPNMVFSVWVVPFLSVARRAFGDTELERVKYWIKYIACTEEGNPWVLFEDFFSSWASTFRRSGTDPIGLSSDASAIRLRLEQFCDVDRARSLLLKQDKQSLSDWDYPRFVRLGLLEIPEDSDYVPFVHPLMLAIQMNQFQHFWRWLSSFVNDRDSEMIASAVMKFAERTEMPYVAPHDLPEPA
jgi:hypothetical protein